MPTKPLNESQLAVVNEFCQIVSQLVKTEGMEAYIDDSQPSSVGNRHIRLRPLKVSDLVVIEDVIYSDKLKSLIEEKTSHLEVSHLYPSSSLNANCVVYFTK
ncbi:hypothetical protein [Vibrio sp. D431a]|uniref:hypothetical protein n=1 Tax=Vibrio sp. D431a TaxID=2837388 RepID=UPI002552A560|nr:hypothetical protein [Vibrio sp. D431a]MDK9793311.1 hypothetical protein [Vibrio sp. D431a]